MSRLSQGRSDRTLKPAFRIATGCSHPAFREGCGWAELVQSGGMLRYALPLLLLAPAAAAQDGGYALELTSYPSNAEVGVYFYGVDRKGGKLPTPNAECKTPCTLEVPADATEVRMYMEGRGFKSRLFRESQFARTDAERAIHVDFRDEVMAQMIRRQERASSGSNRCDGPREGDDVAYCFRFPPAMPFNARKSGHCDVSYDVDPKGYSRNVTATECTDEVFRFASEYTVGRWRHHPQLQGGQPVWARDQETRMSFRMRTQSGKVIPEHRKSRDPFAKLKDF